MTQPYQPQPPYPGPPFPQPPKPPMPTGQKIAIIISCILIAPCFLGILIVAFTGGEDTDNKPTNTVAAAPVETSAPPAPVATKASTPPAKTTTKKPKPTSYSDGDHAIGKDIPAGTYQTSGAKKGLFELCLISTEPNDPQRRPQYKSANADERIIITLAKEDGIVSISGCEPLKPRN